MTAASQKAPDRFPALALAAVATGCAVFALAWTEEYSPAGSPHGWLIAVLLTACHVPLFVGGDRWRVRLPRLPAAGGFALAAAGAVVLLTAVLVVAHGDRFLSSTITPLDSADMGLLVHATARLDSDEWLYETRYHRLGFTDRLRLPPLRLAPFLIARAWQLEWRFASTFALALAGLALAGVCLAIGGTRGRTAPHLALLGIVVGGAAWFASFRTAEYLQWGSGAVLWPLLPLLGLCLARRWTFAAGTVAGALAAMSSGWLLMLLPVGIVLWSMERDSTARAWAIGALIAVPIAAYGYFRGEMQSMGEGVLGAAFREGMHQLEAGAWRYPSLHGLGDLLGLRAGLYLGALLGLLWCAAQLRHAGGAARRAELLAAAAFLLLIAGPSTLFFHWCAHGLLLAGLLALSMTQEHEEHDESQAALPGWLAPAVLAVAAVVFAFLIRGQLTTPIAGALDRTPDGAQSHDEFLLAGWNVWSEDHVWGRETAMATGFLLDRAAPGRLQLRFGTLGGDFTPFNPVIIRINGRAAGLWRDLPGEYSYAIVPLTAPGLLHRGFNTVEFETNWVRTPRSLNAGNDDRRVSIAYLGMQWLPEETRNTTE